MVESAEMKRVDNFSAMAAQKEWSAETKFEFVEPKSGRGVIGEGKDIALRSDGSVEYIYPTAYHGG